LQGHGWWFCEEDVSVSRQKGSPRVTADQKLQAVLSILAGELTLAEAARRYGVVGATVQRWRDRFLEGGRRALLDESLSGPVSRESLSERRLRMETEQLKLALAEATVQLRIWQKGAEHVDEVPSKTSRR
jgi:transposase